MLITGETKVKEALKAHPELKEVLIGLHPRFKKLDNPAVFKLVGRWARMKDVARIGGLSVCEVLYALNSELGQVEEMYHRFPNCLEDSHRETVEPEPWWFGKLGDVPVRDMRGRDDFFFPELHAMLKTLKPGEALKVLNGFDPVPLKGQAEELGLEHYTRELGLEQVEVTFYRPEREAPEKDEVEAPTNEADATGSWRARKDEFELLDVVGHKEDPFHIIMERAQSLNPGEGFVLRQAFIPEPLINMLEGMGFEHEVEQISDFRFKIYFYKTRGPEVRSTATGDDRVPVVLQSATPVVWPVLMRMLQSERLQAAVRFEEIKVWDKTEKHLGWMVKKKADVSFSAVVAATRLYAGGLDIKMMSVDVWDNFHVISRDPGLESFEDLKRHTLHLPLIKTAPPAAVTKYLIKAQGMDPADFEFGFAKGFGRPDELQAGVVLGLYDAVLLREPEASYALHAGRGSVYQSISYADVWRELHPDVPDLPNAGLVFKGEFLREHPAEARLIMEEVGEAIRWVNEHPQEAAALAWDIMGQPKEAIELFLGRVRFDHRPAAKARDAVFHYLEVLEREGAAEFKGGLDRARGFFTD